MINTLDEFIYEFKKIRDKGWIRTHRSGPTGVGKTLEDLLGIPENNYDEPDFGVYELKSCRDDSNSMLTIFTKTPQPKGAVDVLRRNFGYSSSAYNNDEKVLHATLSADRPTRIAHTGHYLQIECSSDRISVVAEDGNVYAYWTRAQLREAFENKYRHTLVYATAESRGLGRFEEFHFYKASEMYGFNYDSFADLLEKGVIYVDLRIGQYHSGRNAGRTHDHGTGFRIREVDQPLLFREQRRLV